MRHVHRVPCGGRFSAGLGVVAVRRIGGAKGTGRNAVSHYDCVDFAALADLPIADLAAKDCALFLWATDPLLPVRTDRSVGLRIQDCRLLLGEAK
jgi:hypothetical protein